MHEVVFDLAAESDPLRRLGVHGLWRLLRYGEGSDRYPGVERGPGLAWVLKERQVVLRYRSWSDLSTLMGIMTGDFRDGFAVPPGYEGDPGAAGVYASMRFHQAVMASWFFAQKGQRRSKSTGDKAQVSPCEATASTPENPRYVTMSYTRHVLPQAEDRLKVVDDKTRALGNVVHPAFAEWNKQPVKQGPLDRFLLSFAVLSYVVTKSTQGYVGIGIDLPTFHEADLRHRLWASSQDPKNVLWVDGSDTTACAFVADCLDFPAGSWPMLCDRAIGLYMHGLQLQRGDTGQLHDLLGPALAPRAKNRHIHGTRAIPVRTMKEDARMVPVLGALDVMLDNLAILRPFYAGLEEIATVVRDIRGKVGLWPREAQLLEVLFERMETSMERKVRQRMKTMFGALVRAEKDRFHTTWEDARERARDFAIRIRLQRAARGPDVLMALVQIRERASCRFFDQEEMDWMVKLSERDPQALRALLCVACETRTADAPETTANDHDDSDFQDE
jgi:hypothetical protein